MQKKIISIIVAIVSIAVFFSGCYEREETKPTVEYVSLSPDGKLLFAQGCMGHDCSYSPQIWNISSEKIISTDNIRLDNFFPFYEYICWSPKGDRIAIKHDETIIDIFEVPSFEQKNDISTFGKIFSFDWSVEGDVFATMTINGVVEIWNATNFSKIKTIALEPSYFQKADSFGYLEYKVDTYTYHIQYKPKISPAGTQFAYLVDNGTKICILDILSENISFFNATNLKEISDDDIKVKPYVSAVDISWSNDGKKIGLIYGRKYQEFNPEDISKPGIGFDVIDVFVWDISSKSLLYHVLKDESIDPLNYRDRFILSPDCEKFAIGRFDGTARLVDIIKISSNEKLLTLALDPFEGNAVTSMDWSRDGTLIVTGDCYGRIYVWDASSGNSLSTLEEPWNLFKN